MAIPQRRRRELADREYARELQRRRRVADLLALDHDDDSDAVATVFDDPNALVQCAACKTFKPVSDLRLRASLRPASDMTVPTCGACRERMGL